jgi:surface antigen
MVIPKNFAPDFLGAATQLPLSGVEYVTYRLYQAGRKIVWPEHWGRVAGSWQRKLRGVKGVRMDVLPHTGAVMEYIIDDVGFVAFVEAVSPANRITISGIGLVHEGQYTEERLEHATWRELRPVFISVL